MKKFIALGVTLVVMLFHFVPVADTADVDAGVVVCDDLMPNRNTRD